MDKRLWDFEGCPTTPAPHGGLANVLESRSQTKVGRSVVFYASTCSLFIIFVQLPNRVLF